MSFAKWRSLVGGYVIIAVEGKHVERFINMTVSRGFLMWDISRPVPGLMLAKVSIGAFPSLRHVSRVSGCRLRIRSKRGLPFVMAKLRRRKMLVVGAVIFFISLYVFSSFVWTVQVTSKEELKWVTQAQVVDAASTAGLKPGILKRKVDIEGVENGIYGSLPQVGWVGVEITGTRAMIEIVEKDLPEESQLDRIPGSIIASKDGVIREILVLAGEPRVSDGDTVQKGEVLISGIIYPYAPEESESGDNQEEKEPGQPTYVKARGIVRARVWYEAEYEMPLTETLERSTGKESKAVAVKMGGRMIVIKGSMTAPFANFTYERSSQKLPWRNPDLPVELITTTYHEMEKVRTDYSMTQAKAEGEKRASRKLAPLIPKQAKIVDRDVRVRSAGEEKIRVRVTVETMEDIGRFEPLQGQ